MKPVLIVESLPKQGVYLSFGTDEHGNFAVLGGRIIEIVEISGNLVFLVDGKIFDKASGELADAKFGLLAEDLKRYGKRGQFTKIAQFYTLVVDGLILTKHIFQGLNRPLYCDGSPDGDQEKLLYSRKPTRDVQWVGGRNGSVVRMDAPKDCVFVVIISPNTQHREDYPDLAGWINEWTWLDGDQGLYEAPIAWVDRFGEIVWKS